MSTKVTIILPVCFNDGIPVLRDTFIRFENEVYSIAGGFTTICGAIGSYRMDDGTAKEEKVDIYTIVCSTAEQVESLRSIALQCCKDFKQECVYFETSECNVEFIR